MDNYELQYLKLKDKARHFLIAMKECERDKTDTRKRAILESYRKAVDKIVNPAEENTLFKLDQ